MAIIIDKINFMDANLIPNTAAVRGVDKRVIPGPANKKVIAGPKPAPFFQTPAKSGSIVHEQTSRIKPLVAAKIYVIPFFILFLLFPINLKIVVSGIRALNAPDMKNAGIRQRRTCADKYSKRAPKPE